MVAQQLLDIPTAQLLAPASLATPRPRAGLEESRCEATVPVQLLVRVVLVNYRTVYRMRRMTSGRHPPLHVNTLRSPSAYASGAQRLQSLQHQPLPSWQHLLTERTALCLLPR